MVFNTSVFRHTKHVGVFVLLTQVNHSRVMYASKFGIFAPTAKIPLADYFSISDKIFHNWNNKFYSINGFFLESSCSDKEEIYKHSTSGIS